MYIQRRSFYAICTKACAHALLLSKRVMRARLPPNYKNIAGRAFYLLKEPKRKGKTVFPTALSSADRI
jgi:hypothetical protein